MCLKINFWNLVYISRKLQLLDTIGKINNNKTTHTLLPKFVAGYYSNNNIFGFKSLKFAFLCETCHVTLLVTKYRLISCARHTKKHLKILFFFSLFFSDPSTHTFSSMQHFDMTRAKRTQPSWVAILGIVIPIWMTHACVTS